MKKIILLFGIFLVTSLIIVSCSKTETKNETYTPLDFNKTNIGTLHNQYVIAAYSKIKEIRNNSRYEGADSTELRDAIINQFKTISYDPSLIGLTKEEFFTKAIILNDNLGDYDYDVRLMPDKIMSPEVYDFTQQIIGAIERSADLTEILNKLNEIEISAINTLSGQNLDIVKGTIIIAKSSSYLWTPQELGGYDLITQTFGRPANSSQSRSWWQGAIIGDVGASSQYFLGIGIAGSAGLGVPGANAVILGGWDITAGLGSAFGA